MASQRSSTRSRPRRSEVRLAAAALLGLLMGSLGSGAVEARDGAASAPASRNRGRGSLEDVGRPWVYVALGDSIPAGSVGAAGYPRLFGAMVRADTGRPVVVRNLARGGSTTAALLHRLRRERFLRRHVRAADIVTVTVGGNDVSPRHSPCGLDVRCHERMIPSLLEQWQAVLDELLALRDGRPGIVRATNYYDPITGNPVLATILGGRDAPTHEARALIRTHNELLCEAAGSRGVPCADVYSAFNGRGGAGSAFARGLMAPDGLHPSAEGQRAIAATLRTLGYAPLV